VNALPLATRHLLLRDFDEGDLPDVHAMRSDPEVAWFMDFAPETLDQSRVWLEGLIFHNRKVPRVAYNLAVVHRGDNRVIGWIGIGDSERYPDEGELGFGYLLNRAYWGQGYATEATQAIVAFGFEVLGGRRVSAWCNAENHASARVLEKAGLRFGRRFSAIGPKSGQTASCLEYALRVEEYQVSLLPLSEGGT
jgi:[ribosomal protein S5]-alanine N-acetyltransferase